MAYTYNLTFVMAPEMETPFLRWMRTEGVHLLFPHDFLQHHPRLQRVVEVGGESPSPEQGLSIALQGEFHTVEDAHRWHDERVAQLVESYYALFKQHPLFFSTLLENVAI